MIVGIIGIGLIGGSIAMGLLESGVAVEVLGHDANPDRLRLAEEKKVISRRIRWEEDPERVDLWVIATPPDDVTPWLHKLATMARPDAVITDCASAKAMICDATPATIAARFVGGHPMAGLHIHGLENAKVGLFEHAHWILTPTDADPDAIRRVEQLVYALDATPVHMSPEEHDRHVATLSHLPNVLANLLSCLSRDLSHAHVAGGSWRDLTRVAGGNPDLWAQILTQNSHEIRLAIHELRSRLEAMDEAIVQGDRDAIQRLFIDGAR